MKRNLSSDDALRLFFPNGWLLLFTSATKTRIRRGYQNQLENRADNDVFF